ncbi:MAG TPA: MFS transporter [Nitrolancea sp.]|nr:MFS transporter [Nitrolancea sp.]
MAFLRALRHKHLAILWLSQVLSAIGDNFYAITIVWMAVRVAGSGAGYVVAAQSLAGLVFGLLGGVFADRWNRRATMIVVDLIRAAAVATLPLLSLLGWLQLWHMAAVGAVIGGLGALFDPALQASLPVLAEDRQLLQATNGLMDMTRRLARAIAPSIVGVLAALLPLSQFFTLDAISFIISAVAIGSLGRRFRWQPPRQQVRAHVASGVVDEIAQSTRLVYAHKPLAWTLGGVGFTNLAWNIAFLVGVPLLAQHVLSGSIGAFGLIVGAYGVTNVIGNLIIGSMAIRRRVVMLFTGRLIMGVGFLVLASAHSVLVAVIGSGIAAFGGPMGDLMQLTMIQTDFPSSQIGKVYSLRSTISGAGGSLGLLLAVPLFARFSVESVIAVCALVMIAVGISGFIRFGFTEPVIPELREVELGDID